MSTVVALAPQSARPQAPLKPDYCPWARTDF
jgi:hypothetical protein